MINGNKLYLILSKITNDELKVVKGQVDITTTFENEYREEVEITPTTDEVELLNLDRCCNDAKLFKYTFKNNKWHVEVIDDWTMFYR